MPRAPHARADQLRGGVPTATAAESRACRRCAMWAPALDPLLARQSARHATRPHPLTSLALPGPRYALPRRTMRQCLRLRGTRPLRRSPQLCQSVLAPRKRLPSRRCVPVGVRLARHSGKGGRIGCRCMMHQPGWTQARVPLPIGLLMRLIVTGTQTALFALHIA